MSEKGPSSWDGRENNKRWRKLGNQGEAGGEEEEEEERPEGVRDSHEATDPKSN